MRRRQFVAALGGTGTVLGVSGVVSTEASAADPTVHTVEFDSWDGTGLVADLYVPATEGPHPAIVYYHGSGGTRSDVRPPATAAARNGYLVLAPDFRGFGDSSGESKLNSPVEVADAFVAIDRLAAGQFQVHQSTQSVTVDVVQESNGDGTVDPTVGMRGASLGGAIQLLAAAATRDWFDELGDQTISPVEEVVADYPFDVEGSSPNTPVDRPAPFTYEGDVPSGAEIDAATPNLSLDSNPLDAIVPRIPWVDLARVVEPNGVVKGSWLTYLNVPNQVPPSRDGSGGPLSLWRQAFVALTAAYNDFPDVAQDFFARRSPDLAAIAANDVPTLLLEEWSDTYIPPEQGLTAYRGIRDAPGDTPVALTISPLDRPGTHSWAAPWESGPGEDVTAYLDAITSAWADRFLKNDVSAWNANREHFSGISFYQRQYPDVPSRYDDSTWPGWRTVESFPPSGYNRETLDLATASATDVTALANTVVPSSARGPTGTLFASSPQADAPASSTTFDFAATEDVDLLGTPTLRLTVTPLGDDAFVFAKFELLESDGATGSVIDSQVMPYRIRNAAGERTTIEYDLVPFQRYLTAGDRLRLVLATTDNGYYNSRRAAGLLVHHAPGESSVTLSADATASTEVALEGRVLPEFESGGTGGTAK